MIVARLALSIALAVVSTGCLTGQCEGAFRWLSTPGESADVDKTKPMTIGPDAVFVLNSDSAEATPAQLLERSKVSAQTFFVAGPSGRVDADIEADYIEGAHSCASASSFSLKPRAPLAPGDYAVLLLVDDAGWPAVFDDDVSTYEGKRALVRRYRVP